MDALTLLGALEDISGSIRGGDLFCVVAVDVDVFRGGDVLVDVLLGLTLPFFAPRRFIILDIKLLVVGGAVAVALAFVGKSADIQYMR